MDIIDHVYGENFSDLDGETPLSDEEEGDMNLSKNFNGTTYKNFIDGVIQGSSFTESIDNGARIDSQIFEKLSIEEKDSKNRENEGKSNEKAFEKGHLEAPESKIMTGHSESQPLIAKETKKELSGSEPSHKYSPVSTSTFTKRVEKRNYRFQPYSKGKKTILLNNYNSELIETPILDREAFNKVKMTSNFYSKGIKRAFGY